MHPFLKINVGNSLSVYNACQYTYVLVTGYKYKVTNIYIFFGKMFIKDNVIIGIRTRG